MKSSSFSFLIFILTFQLIACFSSRDLCNLVEKECKGVYDSRNNYRIECDFVKCHAKHKYACGPSRCSVDKETCENFLKIPSISLLKFKKVKENIRNCSIVPYHWQAQDICLNGRNCSQQVVINMRSGNVKYEKVTNCPCRGHYSYNCGKTFCAINQKACKKLTVKLENTNNESILSILDSVKHCGNANLTLKKTLRLFRNFY